MNGPTERTPAEELLVRFLAESAESEERRFRALCAAWPEHARELRRLRAELRCVDRLLSEQGRRRCLRPPWMWREP